MRRCKQALAAFALCVPLALSLCACGDDPSAQFVGTWNGSGDLDLPHQEAPFEFAQQWTFSNDGAAIAVIDSKKIEFSYFVTDDTLTLSMDDSEISWGIAYKLKGNTLSISMGSSGYAEFTKIHSFDGFSL